MAHNLQARKFVDVQYYETSDFLPYSLSNLELRTRKKGRTKGVTVNLLEGSMRMFIVRALFASAILITVLMLIPVLDSTPAPALPSSQRLLPTFVPTIQIGPLPTPTIATIATKELSDSTDCCTTYLPQLHKRPPLLARNVILLIGDGMGLEQVKAGGMYLNGDAGTLPFEQFPFHALVTTYSASSEITDSGAAATAMATGRKVYNEVISEALPGNGAELYTVLEYARDNRLATGLVTTTQITNATPASFGAHTDSRDNQDDIAHDYLYQTRPNVLFGGGYPTMTISLAMGSDYTVVINRDDLLNLNTEAHSYVFGRFGDSYLPYEVDGLGDLPHLSEMAGTALRVLDNDPDGFFLMIEGGRIDTAAHNQDITRMVGEMAEFARTTQVVIDWAQDHPDTLIVVLADHETGGLQIVQNSGAGMVPAVTWSTTRHTAADIGVWVSGGGLDKLPAQLDNTQIYKLITGQPLD